MYDFKDIALVRFVRIDTPERLKNLELTTEFYRRNCINVQFIFVEDDDHPKSFHLAKENDITCLTNNTDSKWRKSAGYNRAATLTGRPYLCFLDVDCMVHPQHILTAAAANKGKTAGVIPHNGNSFDIDPNTLGEFQQSYDYNLLKSNLNSIQTNDSCKGGAVVFSREAFFMINGFNPNFRGWGWEDLEILRRSNMLGYQPGGIDDPEAIIWHIQHPANREEDGHNYDVFKESADNKDIVAYTATWVCNNRLQVNIRDTNFLKEPSCCHLGQNAYFDWVRENIPVGDTCFFTDLHLREAISSSFKRKVGWLMEPRAIFPQIYDYADNNYNEFDFILTYDRQLLESGRNFLYYPHGRCWIKQRPYVKDKNKLCSTIISAKTTTEGHKLRIHLAQKYKDRFDVFGGANNEFKRKEEPLNEYFFSLNVENSQADYYITEKLIDCFIAKTIPIYWGCQTVGDFFDIDGILTFNTEEELVAILDSLTPELYHSKMKAITYNFRKAKKYLIPEDWIFENYPFLFKENFII